MDSISKWSSLEKDYDIIIADEILYAVQLGLLSEEKVIQLKIRGAKNDKK